MNSKVREREKRIELPYTVPRIHHCQVYEIEVKNRGSLDMPGKEKTKTVHPKVVSQTYDDMV